MKGRDVRVATIIRKTFFVVASVALVLVLLVGALALVIGPVLNAPATRRLAEETVRSLTGYSCRIERIQFEVPFRITVHAISLEGQTGMGAFDIHIGRAAIASSPRSLAHARVDEIRVDALEIEVAVSVQGSEETATALEGRPFEIPDWVWRIEKASVHVSTARVRSKEGSACLEDILAAWALGPEAESGRLKIALRDRPGRREEVVLPVSGRSVTALPGPVVLPGLDLAPLAGLAGLDVPVTGTLSGAAFPVPGPDGIEALYLEFTSDDLSLDEERFNAGFSSGSLRLGGLVLLPQGSDAGLSVFVEEVTASLDGLTLAGKRPGPGLQPLELSGSLRFDTLSDSADWTLDARDGREDLSIRTRGTLAGVLAGSRQATASALARARDLGALATALSSWAALPAGAKIEGGASVSADLAGDLESMRLKGSVRTSHLRVAYGPKSGMPVRLDAAFSGSLRTGGLQELEVEANRFEVGEISARKASVAYGPDGVTGKVTIDSMDGPRLASLLGPFLPGPLAAYQWGGTVHLSANARTGIGEGSPIRGGFEAGLRDGKFASPDYQRMGEGIDFDVSGTFLLPKAGFPVDLVLDAALTKGEIVVGELYGSLARTRPLLHADLRLDPGSRALRLRSAEVVLDGVGTVGLTGRLSQEPGGMRAKTRIQAGPLHLDALLDRILRDGVGGLYPGVAKMALGGTLEVATDLDVEDGSFRARGRLRLEEALLDDPSQGLSAGKIGVDLPFSLASAPDETPPGPAEDRPEEAGVLTIEGVDFRGLEIPKIHARVLLAGDRLMLQDPMRIEFAGGSVSIAELVLQGLGSDRPKGRATAEIEGLDLEPVARALAGKAIEGRLSGRFDRLCLVDGTWEAAGRLGLRVRDGELLVEGIELRAPPSGRPTGRCAIRASGIPLEAISREFTTPPLEGTLDGDLPTVKLSKGKVETQGTLTLSTFGGTVTVSKMRATGLPGPAPVAHLDVDLEEIDLTALTSPLRFGYVSGVLRGRIHGLSVRPGFPFATAFDADLETVKRRGVPRKIDATAVETLSRIGGSNQLASVLSVGLYRFFDEYYYRKMGIRAVLEDGWLELHGIPKGGKEYLIIRALWLPTLSMPITVMTADNKIRFKRWLTDIMRVGEGR